MRQFVPALTRWQGAVRSAKAHVGVGPRTCLACDCCVDMDRGSRGRGWACVVSALELHSHSVVHGTCPAVPSTQRSGTAARASRASHLLLHPHERPRESTVGETAEGELQFPERPLVQPPPLGVSRSELSARHCPLSRLWPRTPVTGARNSPLSVLECAFLVPPPGA
ncbi:hypothetical protein HJG60_012286 [Phyllostomus discolor]|uniref:Uncharacterized protein n=1 Tax=Phyllostomus discolor TaxID=89673 RepID=A0A833ZED2_9CHIR|nr:hypothetical protein HJG60_012286 [Phyllostomus discolor]